MEPQSEIEPGDWSALTDDDGPVGDDAVHTLVAILRQPPLDEELRGESEAVAMFLAARHDTVRAVDLASPGRWRRRSARALVLAGGLTLLSATGAAAATGSLPAPMQQVAAATLGHLGFDVPRPDPLDPTTPSTTSEIGTVAPEPADGPTEPDPTTPEPSAGAEAPTPDGTTGTDAPPAGSPDGTGAPTTEGPTGTDTPGRGPRDPQHPGPDADSPSATPPGQTISSIAQDPATTGRERGEAVSSVASEGRSSAGRPPVAPPTTADPDTTTTTSPPTADTPGDPGNGHGRPEGPGNGQGRPASPAADGTGADTAVPAELRGNDRRDPSDTPTTTQVAP